MKEGSRRSISFPRTFFRRRAAVQREIHALIARIREASPVGLHLGAGANKIPGLINCDLFNEAADRKIDGGDLSEFKDRSVDLIETHHMIEHLSFDEAGRAFQEWARVLKPGGYLVLSCPDLTGVALLWMKRTIQNRFGRRPERRDYILKMIYGSQEREGMFHKSGYDRAQMEKALARYGLGVEFSYTPYPPRTTPSLVIVARKR